MVRVAGTSMSAVDGGVIETPSDLPPETRLGRIHAALAELMDWHEPASVGLEDLYFGKNVKSALAVGQARGVAMLAAAERGLSCSDYTPQAVKMAVCGSGGRGQGAGPADGRHLLGLPAPPASDHAADALAVAICHAGHIARHQLRRRPTTARRRSRDRIGAGRGARAPGRPRRDRHRRRRLPPERVRRDAQVGSAPPARRRRLHAHLVVRDDAMQLLGFATEEERDLFLHLNSVSGVGPKVAMAILSGGLAARALEGDRARRRQALPGSPGVGKRTAERLIVELREKVAGELESAPAATPVAGSDEPRLLARDGLVGLGYTLMEAERLLDGAEGEAPEELISIALRRAGDATGSRN